jgi:hypothetical protein
VDILKFTEPSAIPSKNIAPPSPVDAPRGLCLGVLDREDSVPI